MRPDFPHILILQTTASPRYRSSSAPMLKFDSANVSDWTDPCRRDEPISPSHPSRTHPQTRTIHAIGAAT